LKPSGRLSAELVDDLVDAGSREHYADAALYDYEYRRRRADVTFYRELAKRRGGPILDLGAGSGRVTIALARDGHDVTAVDRSPGMLAKLRERVAALPAAVAGRVEIVAGDLCTFAVTGKFPLVIAAFNTV
jgi:SAM-dependent methyltransferase